MQFSDNIVRYSRLAVSKTGLQMNLRLFTIFKKSRLSANLPLSPPIQNRSRAKAQSTRFGMDRLFKAAKELHKSKKFVFWLKLVLTLVAVIAGVIGAYYQYQSYILAKQEKNQKFQNGTLESPPKFSTSQPPVASGKYQTVIMVARFNGPDPERYRVTDTIIKNLREVMAKYDDVAVEGIDEIVDEEEGPDRARSLGNEHKAALVLWGWYGKGEGKGANALATVHFEFLHKMAFISPASEQTSLTVPAHALDSFELQASLPRQLNQVSLLVVGASRFDRWDLGGAVRALDAALQGVELANDARIYICRALAHMMRGEFDFSMQDLALAIRREPTNAMAHLLRGIIFCIEIEYQPAIKELVQALNDDATRAAASLYLAQARLRAGMKQQALEDFKQANRYAQESAINDYSTCAFVAAALHKSDDALKCANKSIDLQHTPGTYLDRANVFKERGDFAAAYADYSTALKMLPESATLYLMRASSMFAKGDYARAMEDCNAAIRLDDAGLYYYLRASIYAATGKPDDAIQDLGKAVDRARGYLLAEAYADRAEAHQEQDRFEDAVADHRRAVAIYPNAEFLTRRGEGYLQGKKWRLALRDFQRAASLAPTLPEIYLSRADTYRSMGDHQRAISDYTRAIDLFQRLDLRGKSYGAILFISGKSELQAYIGRAITYGQVPDYDKQVADWTAAIEIKPDADLYRFRGYAYQRAGNMASALKDFTKAIEMEPSAENYQYRARALAHQGNPDLAVEDYTAAIKEKPDVEIYVARAGLMLQRGEADKAIDDYTKAIALNASSDNYTLRARTFVRIGEFDEAIADYARALERTKDAETYVSRAKTFIRKGEFERAIADYTSALALDSNANTYLFRFNAYLRLGKKEQAAEDWKKVVSLHRDAINRTRRASTLTLQNKLEKAIRECNEAVREWPTDEVAYFTRGVALLFHKEYDKAISDLNLAIVWDQNNAIAYCLRGLAYQRQGASALAMADFTRGSALHSSAQSNSVNKICNEGRDKINESKNVIAGSQN